MGKVLGIIFIVFLPTIFLIIGVWLVLWKEYKKIDAKHKEIIEDEKMGM